NSLQSTGCWVCKRCCFAMPADDEVKAVLRVSSPALSDPFSQVQMQLRQNSDRSIAAILKQCHVNSSILIYAIAKIPFPKPGRSTLSNISSLII
ncbi:hypothetical protein M758_UG186800, partial [Ceratodon purpureus]